MLADGVWRAVMKLLDRLTGADEEYFLRLRARSEVHRRRMAAARRARAAASKGASREEQALRVRRDVQELSWFPPDMSREDRRLMTRRTIVMLSATALGIGLLVAIYPHFDPFAYAWGFPLFVVGFIALIVLIVILIRSAKRDHAKFQAVVAEEEARARGDGQA